MASLQLSGVIDPRFYDDPEWAALHDELETYSVGKHVWRKTEGNIYRKGWELTHCLYGLHQLGAVHENATGLGVGVGHEPTIFYLGERVRQVVATDLYGNDGWAANEASALVLSEPEKFCPRPVDMSRIRFQIADGMHLPFGDASFDFCWSLSSIEHFGGHEGAKKAMREIGRVIRPGGIACIATEYLLLEEQDHHEFFNRANFEKYIVAATPLLVPVDTVRYDDTLPVEYLIDSVPVPQNRDRRRRHVVLNAGTVQLTSIIIFMRRPD